MAALNSTNQFSYLRHRPERNLLYQILESYWPLFLAQQRKVGKILPLFIHREFDAFLECGIPENGFVRTYCYQCRHSGVVAFSCKMRGFCPSCCARRMNDEAAHLVDRVLPKAPFRQWVLSFPFELRYLMAFDQKITNFALKLMLQTIASFQKKRARRQGLKSPQVGAVTFIQRFGSALNLNVHFHVLFSDGVFFKSEKGFSFLPLPPPSQAELYELATKIRKRVLKKVQEKQEFNQIQFDDNQLGNLARFSIEQKSLFGEWAGAKLKRFGVKNIFVDPEDHDPTTANVDGFSLNARVRIKSCDRKKLERLLRYMARGPIATERLTHSVSGDLLYKMKTPWRDGTTHVSFSPLDFIARLVALIPPPRMNMIRYFGVFAPNFRGRDLIVPKLVKNPMSPSEILFPEKVKRERLRWAEMLKRTFEIDVTVCPKCQGRLAQIAVIKDKAVAKAILKSLQEVSHFHPLQAIEDRGPPMIEPESNDFDQRNAWW